MERRLPVEPAEAMSSFVKRPTASISMMPGAGALWTRMGWIRAGKLRGMSDMTMVLQIMMMSRRMILSALFRCAAPEKPPESAKKSRLLVFWVIIVVTVML